jgi:hypothetical protein
VGILATKNGYLAQDGLQIYQISCRIGDGKNTVPFVPHYNNLAMTFMAAAHIGEDELDYEAEEAAILSATDDLNLYLSVEESGNQSFLKNHVRKMGRSKLCIFPAMGILTKKVIHFYAWKQQMI